MSKPLDLETQRPYALDQLTQLQSQIMQSVQSMVVQRARIEKYRQSDLVAARDTYTELEQIRRDLTEQIMRKWKTTPSLQLHKEAVKRLNYFVMN